MRALKRFFLKLFKEDCFCGLDVGSRKIKACLSRVQDAQNLQLLAVNEGDTRGLKDMSVNDIAAFSGAVGSVLEGLAARTKIRFRDLYLGVGGELVETRMSKAVIPLVEHGNKVIVPSDVRAARRQARLLGVRLEEEVVADMVRQFRVDDVIVANNPVGLYGRKLEVETLLVTMNITRLRNITKSIRQAGYDVSNVFFNGEALAEAVTDDRQRADGCVLVDLGARKTEIFIFKDGLLKHYNYAFFGGERMSQKLAEALAIPFALAEDIKKTYGRVGDGVPVSSADEVLVRKEQGFIPVKRAAILAVVEEEAAALTEHIRDAVAASGQEGQLKSGIIMAGGGVLLTGLMERVESSLHLPVAMARNIPGLNNSSLYSISTSLAEQGYKGSPRYIFDTRKPKDWIDAIKGKAVEMCNEYF